jgi:hypothetical protein
LQLQKLNCSVQNSNSNENGTQVHLA